MKAAIGTQQALRGAGCPRSRKSADPAGRAPPPVRPHKASTLAGHGLPKGKPPQPRKGRRGEGDREARGRRGSPAQPRNGGSGPPRPTPGAACAARAYPLRSPAWCVASCRPSPPSAPQNRSDRGWQPPGSRGPPGSPVRTGRATWPRQALPGGRARSRGQTAAKGRGARRARERLHQATDRSGEITPSPPPQPPFPPLSIASGSAASFITSRCRLLPACPAAGRRSQPGHRTDGARPPPGGKPCPFSRRPRGGESRTARGLVRRGSRRPGRVGPGPPAVYRGALRWTAAAACGKRSVEEARCEGGPWSGGRARDGRREVLH